MSTTAGYRPVPPPGRYTSPTRLTPSLAGIVTSDSFVLSAACAGAAVATLVAAIAATVASSAYARPWQRDISLPPDQNRTAPLSNRELTYAPRAARRFGEPLFKGLGH